MDFDPDNILLVDIDKVKPNEWNPKLKETPEYKRVVESIQVNGLKQPILVREVEDGYEITDGEQRWTACKELGYEKIYIYNLGPITEEKAKALTIWFETVNPLSEIKLAPLVVELNDLDMAIPYDEEQIKDFASLLEFNFVEEPDIETLTVPMTPEQFDNATKILKDYQKETGLDEAGAVMELTSLGVKHYE